MLYVTLLDQFHPGIYSSQVIDVCNYLNEKHNAKIRLCAFLSIREIKTAKPKIKELSPNAIVLPAFPGIANFQLTAIFLFFVCLFKRERVLICRNVFCSKTALLVKKTGVIKKVILDGRSAYEAEIREYDSFPHPYLKQNVLAIEKAVVNTVDFRIAVSQKLVNYWKEKYRYSSNKHVVIPCTLDNKVVAENFNSIENNNKIKSELGILSDDILIAYAGSTAAWQSFKLMESFLEPLLKSNSRIKVLFLSNENEDNLRMKSDFPDRIIIKWLNHGQVSSYLSCADYGLLLREQSDTNLVASPTKFAEYLNSGLKVIISKNLGDFSDFVTKNNCGIVISSVEDKFNVEKTSIEEKVRLQGLANNYFRKYSKEIDIQYFELTQFALNNNN
ncbi:MAG: hypothetical protein V4667_05630 [Bacteroidota bacterium]